MIHIHGTCMCACHARARAHTHRESTVQGRARFRAHVGHGSHAQLTHGILAWTASGQVNGATGHVRARGPPSCPSSLACGVPSRSPCSCSCSCSRGPAGAQLVDGPGHALACRVAHGHRRIGEKLAGSPSRRSAGARF